MLLTAPLILTGFAIILILLVILIGVVVSIRRSVNNTSAASSSPQAAAPGSSSTPAPITPKSARVVPVTQYVQPGISQEIVAVISAAIAAFMDEQAPGADYSVTSIRQSAGASAVRMSRPVWGFAGMQQNTRPF